MCLLRSSSFPAQRRDRRVQHRLAAADGNHRRPALVRRPEALLQGEHPGDRGFILPDAPAPRAREIAGVQRLQHQHERKTLPNERVAAASPSLPRCPPVVRVENPKRIGTAVAAARAALPLRGRAKSVP